MTSVSVAHEGDDRFAIDIRGHLVRVDQPLADGGGDTAPTPTELFIASLASCIAFYARRYLRRHGLSEEGLAVTAEAEMAASPARVGGISVIITTPDGIPEGKLKALLAVASHCTVHNTLTHTPQVSVRLA